MIRRFAFTVLAGIAFSGTAVAGSITSCNVSASGVSFGTFAGAQVTSNGTITLTCNGNGNNNPYTIALSTGGAGSYPTRKMTNGPSTLSYNLYQDAAYTQIWGDNTGGSTILSGTMAFPGGNATTVSPTLYGRLPAQAIPAPGSYSDTITVTVTY